MMSMITIVALFLMLPVLAQAKGAASAEVLSAYATSSSQTSTSVLSLLDGSGHGSWTPESRDFGADEGIYVQFTDPVPVNYIDVELKGDYDSGAIGLNCYLDGKTSLPGESKVEFWAVPRKAKAGKGHKPEGEIYRIVQRTYPPGGSFHDVPLHSNIRAFYFRFVSKKKVGGGGSPTVTAIRFIGPKGAIPMKLPRMVSTQVQASSVLEPFTAYQPANLFDSRPDFSWSTDGKKTDGVGETLDITFAEAQNLDGMVLWNGYQRSEAHFQANGRVSSLEVSADGGELQTFKVGDKSGPQRVLFPKPLSNVRKLRLKIAGIYPGNRYKDVLMSELKFLDDKGGLILPVAGLSAPETPVDAQAYLDKTWGSVVKGGEDVGTPETSLRIRSNGGFVLYEVTKGQCEGGCVDQRISEGNWEFKGGHFHIFGKKYTSSYYDSVYLQSQQSTGTYGIFQSPLSILPYKSLPKAKRLALLRKLGPFSNIQKGDESPTWTWHLPDMGRDGLSGSSLKDLLAKADQHLLQTDCIYVETNDLADIMMPNDQLTMEVEFY